MTDTHFSFAGYSALISALQERGYSVTDFAGADPAKRHLILRHDVDLSLDAAAEMAAFEAERGLAATYFVLVRTEFYNPFSDAGARALSAMRSSGHKIGLHFDAALYTDEEIEAAAERECRLLEAAAEAPVDVISFHRPASARIGAVDGLAGRLSAYGPRFVTEMGYCSDSRGGWHRGHPLDHPAVRRGSALHLLTHPIWWQGPDAAATARLKRFLASRGRFIDRELARHCTLHIPNDDRDA